MKIVHFYLCIISPHDIKSFFFFKYQQKIILVNIIDLRNITRPQILGFLSQVILRFFTPIAKELRSFEAQTHRNQNLKQYSLVFCNFRCNPNLESFTSIKSGLKLCEDYIKKIQPEYLKKLFFEITETQFIVGLTIKNHSEVISKSNLGNKLSKICIRIFFRFFGEIPSI